MNEQQQMEERMQVKCNFDTGRLHIQGVSMTHQQGRRYGMAIKMRTNPDVSAWLREQPAVLKSAASGELLYTPMKVYKYSDNTCQLFIPGSPANHPEGAVLDLNPKNKNVASLLRFAMEAGQIEEIEGGRWMPDDGSEE
tara:strand:+ start:224 stop:640 length:417 start_codon:yes stop_codon:yes gene_type:complete